MCHARCQQWLFYHPLVVEVTLLSSRHTEAARAEEGAAPLRRMDGLWSRMGRAHLCLVMEQILSLLRAGLTSAVQLTALPAVLHRGSSAALGWALCTVPCSGGTQHPGSGEEHCVIPCCGSAQSRHADESKSCEKQMSRCSSPPACEEAGISVLCIKETLDPMWSIPPPNYYELKDLNFCEVSQVKRGKNISGKVRKSVHFYKYLLVCIPLTLHD